MALRFKSYIGICVDHDPSAIKYVTGFGEQRSVLMWEYGKPAMAFSNSGAKDYILGLALNGYEAVVIEIPDCYNGIGNYNATLYERIEGSEQQ